MGMNKEREIIQMTGSREQKIAKAKKIKTEFEQHCPEMAALRRELISAGMCKDSLSSVSRIVTESIDYSALRDDPLRYHKLFNNPPIITKEIPHAVQARMQHPFSAADLVHNARRSGRRR